MKYILEIKIVLSGNRADINPKMYFTTLQEMVDFIKMWEKYSIGCFQYDIDHDV